MGPVTIAVVSIPDFKSPAKTHGWPGHQRIGVQFPYPTSSRLPKHHDIALRLEQSIVSIPDFKSPAKTISIEELDTCQTVSIPDFKSPAKTMMAIESFKKEIEFPYPTSSRLPKHRNVYLDGGAGQWVSIPDFKSPAKTVAAPFGACDEEDCFHTRLQVACQNN